MCLLPEGLDVAAQRERFGAVRELYEQLRREGALALPSDDAPAEPEAG